MFIIWGKKNTNILRDVDWMWMNQNGFYRITIMNFMDAIVKMWLLNLFYVVFIDGSHVTHSELYVDICIYVFVYQMAIMIWCVAHRSYLLILNSVGIKKISWTNLYLLFNDVGIRHRLKSETEKSDWTHIRQELICLKYIHTSASAAVQPTNWH